MTLVPVRRALHGSHALLTVALLVTGLLMGFPGLRARLVGGYGTEIWELHLALGLAFVALPLLALAAAGRGLARDAGRRLGPPRGITWRKVHLVASVAATLVLGLSGIPLGWDEPFPLVVLDGALLAHQAASWFLLGLVAIHLVAARRRLAAKLRGERTLEGDQGDPLLLPPEEPRVEPTASTGSISTGTPRGTCTGPVRKTR